MFSHYVIPTVHIKLPKVIFMSTVVNAVASTNSMNETKSKLDYIVCVNGISFPFYFVIGH